MQESNTEQEVVLNGRLSDFDVETLMQVFSLGRAQMVLEVLSPNGAVVGRVTLKGGQVLAVSAGRLSGVEALRRLLAEEGSSLFRVVKDSRPS